MASEAMGSRAKPATAHFLNQDYLSLLSILILTGEGSPHLLSTKFFFQQTETITDAITGH